MGQIAAGHFDRLRECQPLDVVDHLDTRRAPQRLPGLFGRHLALGLDVAGHRVADERRHPNGRVGDAHVRIVQHLVRFVDHLPLFARVAVPLEHVDEGNEIARDLVLEDRGRGYREARCHIHGLPLELEHAADGPPRRRLVGRRDQPGDPGQVVDRFQDHDRANRGAIRIGDDARVPLDVLGIDLGDNQGHFRVETEGPAVVDGDCALAHGFRHQIHADIVIGGEQGDVHAFEGRFCRLDRQQRPVAEADRRANEILLLQDPQFTDGETVLFEDLDHRGPHETERACHCHVVGLHRCLPLSGGRTTRSENWYT